MQSRIDQMPRGALPDARPMRVQGRFHWDPAALPRLPKSAYLEACDYFSCAPVLQALFDIEIEQPETSQEPNAALVGPVASRAGPFAAAAQQAAPGGRPGYQGAWNRFKTGIPKKDTEHLYECMAEIGELPAPLLSVLDVSRAQRVKMHCNMPW